MHELVKSPAASSLLGAAFNQDSKCFAIAHATGFRVYNSDPMEAWVARDFEDGGLLIAAMLHRTNYLALVGGGPRPKFPQNKVVVWDDLKQKAALVLEFVLPVLNVLMTRTRLVVILLNRVHVYSFASPPVKLASYDTAENPAGVAVMLDDILAFPGLIEGRIQIVDTAPEQPKTIGLIRAHRSAVRALALAPGYVASASTKGTIIRLHEIPSTQLVHEFRRGLDTAIVYSMAFSALGDLAVLSDKSTLHIFETSAGSTHRNRRHVLRGLPLGKKYFGAEWSFVSAQTHENGPGVLGWVADDSIVVLWKNTGRWEKYAILRDSRELVREAWRRFDVGAAPAGV